MWISQFTGPPCGQYKHHTFYGSFQYCNKQGKSKKLKLGDFFFVRISADDDPCIGELQLLCSNKNNDQLLSALRLYFLPEQTPDGRLSHHGEDEVLVASDRVVLKLEDLVSWITEEVEWNHGIIAPRSENPPPVNNTTTTPAAPSPSSTPSEVSSDDTIVIKKEEKDENVPSNDDNNNDTSSTSQHPPPSPPKEEEKSNNTPADETTATAPEENTDNVPTVEVKTEDEKEQKDVITPPDEEEDKNETKVLVLSYQSYCRYRTMLRRLQGGDLNEWLHNEMILALGGITPPSNKTHILFSRDMFEHDELAHHELNCEYLAPVIKGKRKKKKPKNRSTSPESVASEEFKEILKSNQKANGLKQPPIKNEQEFLQRLFKFMKKRNTPIHRVPHLGFKQIDLYVFYSFAQKLGGYDNITGKRLWKHVYDELGGNPGSTSAATCTRRHYERLLLPFERFMEGIIYKPVQRGKKSKKKPQEVEGQEENTVPVKTEPVSDSMMDSSAVTLPGEAEDAYTFTDSYLDNSKDSNSNEFNNSISEDQQNANENVFSDDDSKTVWSIQKQPDNKDEVDKEDTKQIKPLIIQGQSETFAEKEKKWDEIRKKNAAERKWVRQSRSNSRGSKTPVPEDSPLQPDKVSTDSVKTEIKTEIKSEIKTEINSEIKAEVKAETNSPSLPPVKVKAEIVDQLLEKKLASMPTQTNLPMNHEIKQSSQSNENSASKFLPPSSTQSKCDVKIKKEPQGQRRKGTPKDSSSPARKKYPPPNGKTNYKEPHAKSWCNYLNTSDRSPYQQSPYANMDGYAPAHLRGQSPGFYKALSEPDTGRDHHNLGHTGRHSVGSMSVSSAISAEASVSDDKLSTPQRRPSVIQHTEYAATSPSPSLSPKQSNQEINPNIFTKDGLVNIPFSSPKVNLLPNQSGYSTTGKVAEWLTKGVHEVVACKTPSTAMEKAMELHDKVMMPSSCKTPGAVGTSKVPVNNSKGKHNSNAGPKTPRSKYSNSRHRNSDGTNGVYNTQSRNNVAHQKSLHPIPPTYNSVMSNTSSVPKGASKYHQNVHQNLKNDIYLNGPYYTQPKRHKANNVAPSLLPSVIPHPSPSPFVRQQTYVTPPLSDIPKMTASTHNDYEFAVLDLSVKKRPLPAPRPKTPPPVLPVSTSPVPEGVCLDLSVKKKPSVMATDNGIENITPPLPLSPIPASQQATSYMHHSSLKPLPTLLALQDLAVEEAARRGYSSDRRSVPPIMSSTVTPPGTGPPLGMPAGMFPGNTHSKLPPGLMNSIPPAAYSKDLAKNMYMPSNARHSQFSPYVIPPFFPSNWTSAANSSSSSSTKQTNSQTSPMAYKGMVNHSVFPKDYPYNVKSQYHPVLCKESSGRYPSNGK